MDLQQNYLLGTIVATLKEVQADIKEIKELQRIANGKTAKHEQSIARLNLVVFGLGGTAGTAVLAAALRYFGG
jgi:hypothetical protein